MASQDENEPLSQKCLEIIVELWVSVQGFAFAEEMYKQKERKSTKKSRSLRSKLSS